MANAAEVLQQAHDLIEAGDYQAARQVLDGIRSSNENNPDFWWVYAHATEDANDGKQAIERVQQLAPNYSGLAEFGLGSPRIQPLRPIAPPPPMGVSSADEFDEFDETSSEAPTSRNPMLYVISILGLIFVVVLIAGVLYVSGIFGGGATPTPEPTQIVDSFTPIVPTSDSQLATTEDPLPLETMETEVVDPTDVATEISDPTETEDIEPTETEDLSPSEEAPIVTEEVTAVSADPFADVMDELAAFAVPVDGISTEESSLGETLYITSCTTPGPNATSNILGIVNALGEAGIELDTTAIAFNIKDCAEDSVTMVLGFSVDAVNAYWAGETTPAELVAALRRIG